MEPDRAANKIIDILSENRILPAQWKFYIPIFIVQQPRPIVANARNLADGILEAIQKYDIHIPDYQYATYEGSKDYQLAFDWEE